MKTEIKTVAGGTLTSDGWIPHYRHNGLDLPVKVERHQMGDGWRVSVDADGNPKPRYYRNSRLAFALPGGLEYVP